MPTQFRHMDASESFFAQREIEFVQTQVYEVRYPNLKMAEMVPINTSMPAWADVGVYYVIDMVGAAKAIDNYGQNVPRASVKKTEFTWRAKRYGISYGWTLDEMKKSAALNVPLEAAEAMAARRAFAETMDAVGTNGDTATGLVGFLGLPNTTAFTVPNGLSGSQLWSTKTPDEILLDMNRIDTNIIDTTSGVGAPDTKGLPIKQYQQIATTRLGDGSDTTILAHYLATNPGKKVVPWHKLKAAGAGGTDRMLSYRNSPDVVEWYIPEPYNQMPVQQRELEFIVICTGKIGSVVSRYPFEISFGDGI